MLQQGQGIFISGGCLHEVVPTKDFDSEYICVNFHPKMIYGYAGSAIHRDYVEPVAFSDELQAVPLYGKAWQKQVCAIMRRLARVNEEQPVRCAWAPPSSRRTASWSSTAYRLSAAANTP